jgi:putative endopeptidase
MRETFLRRCRIAVASAALALPLCAPGVPPAAASAGTPTAAGRYLDAFVDRSADPRHDFFQFAVGKWLKDNPIPASERSWGIARVVQEETYLRLKAISEAAAARGDRAAPGGNERKIGDFWHAAMDTATVERQGLRPLDDAFARIEAVGSRRELVAEIGRLQRMGVDAMCSLYVFQDEKRSDRYALHLYQGGLGLPDRDYYVDDDARSATLRTAYVEHVARTLELLGDAPAKARANAATVMALETDLARASRTLAALRDPVANYHEVRVDALAGLAASIPWPEYLAAGGLPPLDSVIVGQPEFFTALDRMLQARPLGEWKAYLRWQLAHAYAPQAGGAFEAEHFRFFGTILRGTPEQRPRWKRMLDEEEKYLGDALGQLYVAGHFPAAAKARYEKLSDEIFAAFRSRLRTLDWMSEATRKRALAKLDTVTRKVGHADRWKDYASYEVTRDSFLQNVVRGRICLTDYEIAKLRKPVDRQEWEMTPQTYNAYYNPSNNEIVLPAAVFLLPGIADAEIDDALVYGYAGAATIGHEITHGFDDTGRQFDERGNLETWWTAEDDAEFKRRARVIVEQFNGYVVAGDLRVNGEATQGENIADLGGLVLGWEAFTRTAQYREGKPLGGFTPAQRYFIGWALGWMSQVRPESLALQVRTDVHAPSHLRVIGPLSNLPEFHEAFGVRPGDAMHRPAEAQVHIW